MAGDEQHADFVRVEEDIPALCDSSSGTRRRAKAWM